MNVDDATKTVLEGLAGDEGLDVRIRLARGLDRDLLRRVLDATAVLAAAWKDRPTVPKAIAGAFVDIGGRLECRFYPEDEQTAFRAAAHELVASAHELFDPSSPVVRVASGRLEIREPSARPAASGASARRGPVSDVERAAVETVLAALVGPRSIPVGLAAGRGIDADSYRGAISGIAQLTKAWEDREEIPRDIGVAFVDIWDLWHLHIDAYPAREGEIIQSRALEIQEAAGELLCS